MIDLLRILISPLVWLASFSAVYGLHGALCGQEVAGMVLGFPLSRLLLIAAYAVAVLLQIVLLVMHFHGRLAAAPGFVRFVSLATGWTGLVAAVWTLFPVVVTTSCI
jgi:hypothetical protein